MDHAELRNITAMATKSKDLKAAVDALRAEYPTVSKTVLLIAAITGLLNRPQEERDRWILRGE